MRSELNKGMRFARLVSDLPTIHHLLPKIGGNNLPRALRVPHASF
jgi:hypothetical protein